MAQWRTILGLLKLAYTQLITQSINFTIAWFVPLPKL